MTPARALALVAAVCVGLGLFLLRLALVEPGAIVAAEQVQGALARTERRALAGEGEAFLLHLDAAPQPIAVVARFDRRPGLLRELETRLAPNASIVAAIARDPERGFGRVSSLDVNGVLVYVADEDRGGALGLLHAALGLAGCAAFGAGFVTLRAARATRLPGGSGPSPGAVPTDFRGRA